MLNDLDHLDWPEKVKTLQRNWIGKSLGAQVDFNIKDSLEKISCFLSEPEAICATSFITISTSHPILKLSKANLDTNLDLGKYLDTGLKAINPISLDVVPIFIASHIEDDYECGAVACVPSHDEKDLQVAKSFSIPILPPVYNQNIITHDIGCGKSRENFKEWILNELKELKIGQESVNVFLIDSSSNFAIGSFLVKDFGALQSQ